MDSSATRPPIAVGHVMLHVSSVEDSARFYALLGCRPVYAKPEMAILELRGGTHLMLFSGEPGGREHPGFDLIVDDLPGYAARLRTAGVLCGEIERHERSGHDLFTLCDPDGYVITCYSDHTDGRPV